MYGIQQGMLQGVGIPLALFLLVSLVLSFPIISYFKKFLKRKRKVGTFLKDLSKGSEKTFCSAFPHVNLVYVHVFADVPE